MPPSPPIDRTELPGLRESFRFPLSTPAARHDLLVGGTVLLIPPLGWVLNMVYGRGGGMIFDRERGLGARRADRPAL